MVSITKAVFPVAGFGTRFLPATKAMPKELLPIVDKPLIQFAVEEAVDAGIDTMIFITGRNKRAIEDHFDNNKELEDALRRAGKNEQADMVKNFLPKGVECIFVRQPEQLGLGDAILRAKRAVSDEPFAVILADDLIINKKKSDLKKMIENFSSFGKSQIAVTKIDGPDISNYGVIKLSNDKKKVTGIIEKPSMKEAPSNQASIGRYILLPEIFELLEAQSPGVNKEIQLADAIDSMARAGKVEAVNLTGRRFDCGSVKGYMQAIKYIAKLKGI